MLERMLESPHEAISVFVLHQNYGMITNNALVNNCIATIMALRRPPTCVDLKADDIDEYKQVLVHN